MNQVEIREQLEQLHPLSYGWAMACCARNPQEALDVLQTAYLKVLDGRARFDGRSEFKTWLFAVIRRTADEERRRILFRRFRLAVFQREPGPSSPVPPPDRICHRTDLHAFFEKIFSRLPNRQRQVLHLVFYDNLTIEQAARAMGVSVGSARTHYERGKQRLRQFLREGESPHEPRQRRATTPALVP